VDEPSQILMMRLSSVGDVLLATPLVRVVRRTYPGALLRFLAKAPFAELLAGNPHVDEVLTWPRASARRRRGERARERPGSQDAYAAPWSSDARRLAAGLRARRPFWLVDIQSTPRSAAFGSLLRPDRTFRWRKDYLRRFLLVHAKVDRYSRPISSVAERYFAAVAPLELRPDGGGLDLILTEAERAQADRLLAAVAEGRQEAADAGIGDESGGWLAVAPGARWATKRWPPESFAAAARAIAAERSWKVVLLGSAEDATAAGALGALLRAAGIHALDLSGRLELRESAAVLARSALLLTNDSGLMHAAAALGVPSVAVFGSTVSQLGFVPYRARARVVEVDGLPCRPCTSFGRPACPLGHFKCMRELEPESVVRAARELLSANAVGAPAVEAEGDA
jgi:heptosyltransferase-2